MSFLLPAVDPPSPFGTCLLFVLQYLHVAVFYILSRVHSYVKDSWSYRSYFAMTGSKTPIILVKIILLTKSNFFRGSFTDKYVILPISSKRPDINMPVVLFLKFM